MKYLVSGEMGAGSERRKFAKEIEASSEKLAKERAYSQIGSAHRLPRDKIIIKGVTKAS